jgi:23S rRNA pseudoU1915 N3-methylase RlmH
LAAILLMPTAIFAKNENHLTKEQKTAIIKLKIEKKVAKINLKQIKTWQRQGSKKIRKDINRLNRLITIANKKTTLTAEQKTTIVNDINSDIASLNTLKEKISSGTVLDTIKADVKSIVSLGSINAKYLPLINHITVN